MNFIQLILLVNVNDIEEGTKSPAKKMDIS